LGDAIEIDGDKLAIEVEGAVGDERGDLAVSLGGDSSKTGEPEVSGAELVEGLDDAIGGSAADTDVAVAEVGPVGGVGEIEFAVADEAEAVGFGGEGAAAEGTEGLASADPGAEIEFLV